MPLITRTSPASLTQRSTTFAIAKMLSHAASVEVLGKTAMNYAFPKNKGDNVKFRRPVPFSAKTTPLVEGVTPNSSTMAYEDVTATIKQYGDWSIFSDQIEDLHEDPIGSDLSMLHGENIGRTAEALDWATVQGGSNVIYANGGARNAVNTPVTINLLRAGVRALRNAKAKPFTEILDASPKFATRAVEGGYIAMGHTNLEHDIRNLPGFLPVAQYGSRTVISEYELGTVESVRFVLSPDLATIPDAGGAYAGSGTAMLTTTGTSADIYSLMLFGKESWARLAPRIGRGGEMPISVKVKNPNGEPTETDPLAQRGIVSWKMYYVSKILNEAWLRRIEVAATSL